MLKVCSIIRSGRMRRGTVIDSRMHLSATAMHVYVRLYMSAKQHVYADSFIGYALRLYRDA